MPAFFFFPLVKMEFGCIVLAGLVFEVLLLPQPPKCRSNRYGPLCLTEDSHMGTRPPRLRSHSSAQKIIFRQGTTWLGIAPGPSELSAPRDQAITGYNKHRGIQRGPIVRFGLELGGENVAILGGDSRNPGVRTAWVAALGGKALGSVSCSRPCRAGGCPTFSGPEAAPG